MDAKEVIIKSFTELLISKIESVSTNWQKPWINPKYFHPRNIKGNAYNAGNSIFLSFLCEVKNFELPIFMTFNQAKELKVQILKGEKSYPVYYYNFMYKHKVTKQNISNDEYNNLSEDKKKGYSKIAFLKYFCVFNIVQTNYEGVYPEKYELFRKQKENEIVITENLTCLPIDSLIETNSLCCPVRIENSPRAYYNPKLDFIVCPLKKQFPKSIGYYSTLLHEMAHSTGHEKRLNRDLETKIQSEKLYAIEELTAELTSAFAGSILKLAIEPQNSNAEYLKHWLGCLKEEPHFLFTILSEVSQVYIFKLMFTTRA